MTMHTINPNNQFTRLYSITFLLFEKYYVRLSVINSFDNILQRICFSYYNRVIPFRLD